MILVERLVVDEEDGGARLDRYLATQLPDISRSRFQHLISEAQVRVNMDVVRASYRVRAGDEVRVTLPPAEIPAIRPEPIPLEITFEDSVVLVVNKPRGMVVHPGAGHYQGTLVNALLHHCRDLSGINGVLRPGIVHRLDKDTSGLLMVAKNDAAHLALAAQLKERRVLREYLALVHGQVKQQTGTVDAPIDRHPRDRQKMTVTARGRPAVTHYTVVERYINYTLLRLQLETGRTHQIRVHLAHIGHPVAGDPKYGPARPHLGLTGQFLHAGVLGFAHPTSDLFVRFEAPLPAELETILASQRRFRAQAQPGIRS
ncbi:MAG: RluA family pseudouridine synthase [Ammonifex sp.]|nr:MAG: RluA family pseudouridine synthase [Ammonifex sp.]